MTLLLSNDDGVHAPGLKMLARTLSAAGYDIRVSAPDRDRSGASNSLTLDRPLQVIHHENGFHSVDGTQTDAVHLALNEFHADTCERVIAGINSGANLAEDISYSGTAAAAMEGTLLGIRSIALSQIRALDCQADFAPTEKYGPELVRKLIDLKQWPEGSFININFPNVAPDEITGIRLTKQGQRPPGSFSIDARIDARSQPYYWVKISYPPGNEHPGTDLHAIAAKAVSITPIKMDFSDHDWRPALDQVIA